MNAHSCHKAVLLLGIVLFFTCSMASPGDSTGPRAFPGAEGFGAYSVGGRGGVVMYVTNLEDSGHGSFRAACMASGRRIVLFKVSGIIELESPLTISEPYLTIAGQTAPGDGVCIKNYGFSITKTHDVVIRYMRFRPGDTKRIELDALTVDGSQRVIIDHCSASWGTDEVLSVVGGGTTDVTIQWCLITESLNNSVHRKGPHGYGSLFRLDGNLSVHHNLYANNSSRNPRPGCYGDMERGSLLDFRNNVVYNWGLRAGYTADDKASINYVANYLRPGPSTAKRARPVAFFVGGVKTRIFLEGNHHEGAKKQHGVDWDFVKLQEATWANIVRLNAPLPVAEVKTDDANVAYGKVLEFAGAVLPKRDPVDDRIITQVKNNTGKIIDTQLEVGGWPVYRNAEALLDTDLDGMPDTWETAQGMNPGDKGDAHADQDGDGYTNIEEFLNSTDPYTKDTW